MKSNNICSSKVLILLLIILLTIIIVHIALNSYNKEMYTDFVSHPSSANFNSFLVDPKMSNQIKKLHSNNPALADNSKLSAMHLNQVYQTRRPELIPEDKNAKDKLCYVNLHK